MPSTITPEIDVIIATAVYLHQGGWRINTISIPTGQGLDRRMQREKLEKKFAEEGIPMTGIRFLSNGPDLIAKKGKEVWKVECKSLGNWKPQTLRNQFDRALSSTVSYFDGEATHIGLALPIEYAFRGLVRGRVPERLRSTLNLWIFLLDSEKGAFWAVGPDGEQGGVQHDVI